MKENLDELVVGDKIITEYGSEFYICTVIGKSNKSLLLQIDDRTRIIFDYYDRARAWSHYIPKKPWYKRLFNH